MTRAFIILLVLSCATPALACNPDLFARLDLPLREAADVALDVSEVQSTEGGEWKLWQGSDGSTDEVARIDYGEMGRLVTRLFMDGATDYGITQTRYTYSVPIYVENSITTRIETDIFLFCDGKLLLPAEDFGVDPDYAQRADDARAVFGAEEIADYVTSGL